MLWIDVIKYYNRKIFYDFDEYYLFKIQVDHLR